MSDVAEDATLRREYPALAEASQKAASQQLRNMATLGGNLLQRTRCEYFRGSSYPCNKRSPGSGCAALESINRGHASDACIATYPGDFAVALAAFDAQVDTASPRGSRTIPLIDLHRLPGDTPHLDTLLESDDLIVRIRVPTSPLGKASTALSAGTVAFADARPRQASQFKMSLGPKCVARVLMIARERSEA